MPPPEWTKLPQSKGTVPLSPPSPLTPSAGGGLPQPHSGLTVHYRSSHWACWSQLWPMTDNRRGIKSTEGRDTRGPGGPRMKLLLSPCGVSLHYPPGTCESPFALEFPSKKACLSWCPGFFLGFHFVGVTDWCIIQMTAQSMGVLTLCGPKPLPQIPVLLFLQTATCGHHPRRQDTSLSCEEGDLPETKGKCQTFLWARSDFLKQHT